jgi:hypothetical protein
MIKVAECRLHPGETVPIDSCGELKRENRKDGKLLWSRSPGGEEMPLLGISELLRDRTSDYMDPVLELRAAVSPLTNQFLIADRYADDIWYVQPFVTSKTAARLERPRDISESLLFLEIRCSPDGQWIVFFCEVGFVAFEAFVLRVVEPYDELLWRPIGLENGGLIIIDHYEFGTREIQLGGVE